MLIWPKKKSPTTTPTPKKVLFSRPKSVKPVTPFTYSADFQLRAIRVLFQDPDFICTVGAYLAPRHFERGSHQWLAEQMLDYAAKHGHGIGLDALEITAERAVKANTLRGVMLDEVIDILETIDHPVKDRTFLKEELFRFVKHQATKAAILDSLPLLDTGDYAKIDELFAQVAEVSALTAGGLGSAFFKTVKARTARRQHYVKDGVPSGLRVDSYLKPGGLPPKTLGVVLAPTNKGKSHILVHIGGSAIVESDRKERVLHVTLELPQEYVEDRYDSWFSRVSINDLEVKAPGVEKSMLTFAQKYGDCLRVKEFPSGTLTVPALKAYIRQLERTGFYPTMVIVDYADEMADATPHMKVGDTYLLQGNIFRGLRGLAGELKIPFWTATQTNKGALKLELIDLDSIGESYAKAKIADLVIAWCQTPEEEKLGKGRVYLCKSRLGPTKIEMPARCDWTQSRVINL